MRLSHTWAPETLARDTSARTLWRRDTLVQEHFGAYTFWCHGHFGAGDSWVRDTLAPGTLWSNDTLVLHTFWCQDTLVS